MKTITFLLYGVGNSISGGQKIVYEYANRLAEDGFKVNIVYPASLLFCERSVYEKLKSIARFAYYFITRRFKPYNWFKLNRKVNLRLVWSLQEVFVPRSDFYIATAMETSEYLSKYKGVDSAHKIYFVQGYESWHFGEARFLKSLKFDLRKITISPFLKQTIEDQGQNAVIIENGFDFEYFKNLVNYEDRNKFSISMLYHTQKLKGVADGLIAIDIIRKIYPQIRVSLFGYCSRPIILPHWIEYYKQPNRDKHNEILNNSAIFLGTSHSEGFSLTVAEAQICGCAVVCTDIPGYATTCINNQTALMSPVANPKSMAANIIKLIENDLLRITIAQNGNNKVKEFSWDKAYNKFKNEINKTC